MAKNKNDLLSRKRRRELKRLRGQAQDLLAHQREVLSHVSAVAQEAGRQAAQLNSEIVMPRVNGAIDGVRPTFNRGLGAVRKGADRVRAAAAPVAAAALLGTVRSLERLENDAAAKQLRKFGEQRGIIESKKKGVVGRTIAIVLGAVAAAGVAFALFDTFRNDDDLWVAEGEEN